jgi:hypothetical protein
MTHETGVTYRLDVGGTMMKADLEQWQRVLAGEIAKHGTVRLLIVLNRFAGWSAGDKWDDMAFYQTHGDRIERMAIVGEDRWREEAMMFVGAGLRKGSVEYFVPGAISQAREWLAE